MSYALAASMAVKPALALADYFFNKPKKPRAMASDYMRKLQEAGLQTANQATSNAGLILGPNASARRMSTSGTPMAALARTAGMGAQEAVQGVQRGYMQALLSDRDAEDQYRERRRQQLSNVFQVTGQAAGDTFGGMAGLQEQKTQAKQQEELLRSIYGDQYDSLFGSGSRLAGAI